MSGRLPQSVQPDRLAERGETLRGTLALKGMARLAEFLHDTDGEVAVELEFGIDTQDLKFVRGHAHTSLHLICQRCLRSMSYPVDIDISLGLAHSEREAERLPETYEPLILDEPSIQVKGIIEDELMLALPIVPAHAMEQCDADHAHFVPEAQEVQTPADDEGRQRPFEGLDELIRRREK